MLSKRRPQVSSRQDIDLIHSRIGSILNKVTVHGNTMVAASSIDRVYRVGSSLDPIFGCKCWPLNVGGSTVLAVQLVSSHILMIVTTDNLVLVNMRNKKVRFLIEKVKTPGNFIWKGEIGELMM